MIRLAEVYLSVQGEGPRVGSRTVFVRSGGCNLRCPGWPCDTPHAIFAEQYRDEWIETSASELMEQINKADPAGTANICFTGGEPFMQSSQTLYDVVQSFADISGHTSIEFFTNGTYHFPDWAIDEAYFILDWKLPGSGETFDKGPGPKLDQTRKENAYRIGAVEGNVIKFTIADRLDYDRAVAAAEHFKERDDWRADFFYGVAWGKLEPKKLIDWVLEDGFDWKYNHQIHNVVWDRTQRGI